MSDHCDRLEKRIEERSAKIGVVGLGRVGLPFAVACAQAGFVTTGIDNNTPRIEAVRQGQSHTNDVSDQVLCELTAGGRFTVQTGMAIVSELDIICICVPIDVPATHQPDLKKIMDCCAELVDHVRPGALIIVVSTTYPGATDCQILPVFEKKLGAVGNDFFLCVSPERFSSGGNFPIRAITRIIGGADKSSERLGKLFFDLFLDPDSVPRPDPDSRDEYPVPFCKIVGSIRNAEMVKLLENTYRFVNISLVNEISRVCAEMQINAWEVFAAAGTKPFGFRKFVAGSGIGGSCIPFDPIFLAWKGRAANSATFLIDHAVEVNKEMPRFLAERVLRVVIAAGGAAARHVHIMGVAYKPDVNYACKSPAFAMIRHLRNFGLQVTYTDPHVPVLEFENGEKMDSSDADEKAALADCVVIVTDHAAFDYNRLDRAKAIIDTCGALMRRIPDAPLRVVELWDPDAARRSQRRPPDSKRTSAAAAD